MISKIRNLQVWLINHLWGKIPLRVKIYYHCPNNTIRQQYHWWVSPIKGDTGIKLELHGLMVVPYLEYYTVHPFGEV